MAGVLDVLNEAVPVPGWPPVATTAVFAVVVSTTSFIYLATGDKKLLNGVNVLGTLVHEAGHVLVSIVTGGDLQPGHAWQGGASRPGRGREVSGRGLVGCAALRRSGDCPGPASTGGRRWACRLRNVTSADRGSGE